jgi:hypothetical protein
LYAASFNIFIQMELHIHKIISFFSPINQLIASSSTQQSGASEI